MHMKIEYEYWFRNNVYLNSRTSAGSATCRQLSILFWDPRFKIDSERMPQFFGTRIILSFFLKQCSLILYIYRTILIFSINWTSWDSGRSRWKFLRILIRRITRYFSSTVRIFNRFSWGNSRQSTARCAASLKQKQSTKPRPFAMKWRSYYRLNAFGFLYEFLHDLKNLLMFESGIFHIFSMKDTNYMISI